MSIETCKQNAVKKKMYAVCRVRPFLTGEKKDETIIVNIKEKNIVIRNQKNLNEAYYYNFDNCYDFSSKQSEIFQNDTVPLLKSVLTGLDATIFCYGMTGAGKTYTLEGTESNPGLIPKCMEYLFKEREAFLKISNKNWFKITISYMEIYKEIIFDLLVPREKQSQAGLAIRETINREIFVADLAHKEVKHMEEFRKEFSFARKNRSTASTKLNSHSSRSHSILGVNIQISDSTNKLSINGKLNLIDLSGSEDNRRTGNNSARLAESGAINKSLFVLGQVVDAINNGAQRVPYRDSKMTRILQPSLSGKALSMIIVNVAPGEAFFPETYQALNFATKSRKIVSSVSVKQFQVKIPFPLKKEVGVKSGNGVKRKESTMEANSLLNGLINSMPKKLYKNDKNGVLFKPSATFNGINHKNRSSLNKINALVNKDVIRVETSLKDTSSSKLSFNLSSDAKEIIRTREKLDEAVELVKLAQSLRLKGNLTDSLKYYVKANESAPEDPIIQQRIAELCKEIQLMTTPPKKSKIAYPISTVKKSQSKLTKAIEVENSDDNDTEEWKYESENETSEEEMKPKTSKKRITPTKTEDRHNTSISKISKADLEQYAHYLEDESHPLLFILNTGNLKMIKSLHGIGPKKANQIIELSNGKPFKKLSQLKEAGINEKAILRILFEYYK